MPFEVKTFKATAGDKTGTAYELTDAARTVRAEVWPHCGFNCLRWQVRQPDGSWGSILYTAPEWETNPVPTRSGHPVLFPFPGRLRYGRLPFQGKVYELPLNDSTKQHAIHGFTPRNPWRVTDSDGGDEWAFITGEFNLRKELPAAVGQWPSDFTLSLTYRLHANKLRVMTTVTNIGAAPLPFGLGFHPYFRLPGVTDPDISGHVLEAHVEQVWETHADNMPTGWRNDVAGELDFRQPRPIGTTALDYVFTAMNTPEPELSGLVEVAVLSHPAAAGTLRVMADPVFRELVLFTPPHRQAVAIEPYTCSADAANLWERGVDSGWRVLPPGGEWEGTVEYRWEPAG
jgi:aldose 1-epimerase